MRLFIKYRSYTSLFLALVLSLFSNISFAALSCGGTSTSGLGRCSQLAASNGFLSNYITEPGSDYNVLNCYGVTPSTGQKGLIGTFACSGTCDNGVVPSNKTGYTCDSPQDDCSTSVSSLGVDLSGSSTDGKCDCPSGTELVGSSSASVSCATPCTLPQVRNSSGVCANPPPPSCTPPQVLNSSGVCANPPPPSCQGNLTLVDGACGCPAGSTLGTFNGVPTCAASSSSGTKQGGGTATTSSTSNSSSVNNSNGTTTTTTTINNTTIVSGASGGSGNGTTSSGSSTATVTTDSTGKVISSSGTTKDDVKQDSLTLPSDAPPHAPLSTAGLSDAIGNAPVFASLSAALSRFPNGSRATCSTINIPLFQGMSVELGAQCSAFEAIRNYLTIFAMVIYGLLSYRIFINSVS